MKPRSLWSSVARSFASAFVIEAISPKISGVTATDVVKDLSSVQFVHSSYYIYDAVANIISLASLDGCVPLGGTLLSLMNSVLGDPVIGTNTCLGYGLTAVSLASSILYALNDNSCGDPGECVSLGYRQFKHCIAREGPDDLIKSIEIVSPSYHGRYYSPRAPSNVLELIIESAQWDLVAYNIASGYHVTLDLYDLAKSSPVGELVKTAGKLYRYAAGRYVDSLSFKSGGVMLSKLVREIASSPGTTDREARDVLVNRIGVNLGSISDIVASSIALILMREEWGKST